jgi:intraflagellar transport protein 46
VWGFGAVLQVERPDGKPESLGLKQLDEPAAQQSDPTVLDLQLRAVSKTAALEPMTVCVVVLSRVCGRLLRCRS